MTMINDKDPAFWVREPGKCGSNENEPEEIDFDYAAEDD